MKIAFYKSSAGGLLDRLIDDFSGTARTGISHVEAVFTDNIWFSSFPGIGPRFSPTPPFPISQWEFVEWPCTQDQELAMYNWAVKQIHGAQEGDFYDWRGDANFLAPIGDDGHKMFCSKAIIWLGQQAGFFPNVNAANINPDVLEQIVLALGWIKE